MELAVAKRVVDVLGEMDVEAEVYEDYSGRGMFGRTTTGIVCGSGDAAKIGYAYAVAIATEAEENDGEATAYDIVCELNNYPSVRGIPTRCDNLGLQMIYY
jgi:hypothetical protein